MEAEVKVLMRTALPRYLRQFEAESTRVAYRRELIRLIEWMPSEITPEIVYDYRDWLTDRGLVSTTVRWRATVARAFLKWLTDHGSIDTHDAGEARLPRRVRTAPPRILTNVELRRLLAAPDRRTWVGRRDAAMLVCLGRGGLRAVEVCRLRVGDVTVREESCQLDIVGKGGHQRRIPLDWAICVPLRGWVRERQAECSPGLPLFPREALRPTTSLDHHAVRYVVAKHGRRVGIHDVHPHQLRHTAAVLAVRSGMPLHCLRVRLGHADIRTTARYLEGDAAPAQG